MTVGDVVRARQSDAMRTLLKLPVLLYQLGLGPQLAKRNIMLLYTTGRRSGLRRVSGLNFAVDGNVLYAAAGWGTHTDWYQNLLAHPTVELQIGTQHLRAHARPVTDPSELSRAFVLLRSVEGGPPKLLEPVMSLLGFDFEAEREAAFRDPSQLTTVAFELASPLEMQATRGRTAQSVAIPLGLFALAAGFYLLIRRSRGKR